MNRREKMYQEIEKHGANLNAIFKTDLDNITLSKKLHSLEVKAHKLAEDYCNGVVETAEAEKQEAEIITKLGKIIFKDKTPDVPIFLNFDARGYALKIDNQWLLEKGYNIHKDWGGYGILAPDFN